MGNLLISGIHNGIKGSKVVGTNRAVTGNGTAPKVISGTKDGKDIGTRNLTDGNGAAIKAMSIGGGLTVGNGASTNSTSGIKSDR